MKVATVIQTSGLEFESSFDANPLVCLGRPESSKERRLEGDGSNDVKN